MKRFLQTITRSLSLLAGILWIALLVAFPAVAADGIRTGLTLCGELLIPSLFPAMTAAALLLRSGSIQCWGQRLTPLTRLLWKLPGCSGAVFLLSMVGGYPIGARCIRHLVDARQLTPAQGAHLLRFCVGAGPGFVVSAVGVGLFGSVRMGLLLWGCQLLAAFLLSLLCRGKSSSLIPPIPTSVPDTSALCSAVQDASSGILTLCGWVLAFCSVRAMFQLLPLPSIARIVLDLLTEVTAGVQTARTLGAPAVAAFALGWGGLCVHAQIAAAGISCRGFMFWRLLHGALAALLTAGLLPLVPFEGILPTFCPLNSTLTSVHMPFSLALLGLVSVFLLQVPFVEKK